MREMPSRYDYEVPGGAAFDYLAKRPDVDAKHIAIMGYSFGGYYSSRIAAFEKRYAACIALSALHWDLAAWQTRIKDANKNAPKSVAQSNFQWRWGCRRGRRGRGHRDCQEVLAEGGGEEHHLPVPGDTRRQRPRRAGRERAEAL